MQLSSAAPAGVTAKRMLLPLLWLALMLVSGTVAAAEPVGEVLFVQGLASAQRPGEGPRFLAKGEPLHEGEVISTGAQGFTLIALKDGSKFTLRPDTSFAIDKFQHGAGKESAIFRLLQGGVRALTGLISKRNPRAVELNTVTATIGIRGTSFDARLCEADCAEEERRVSRKARAVRPELIVARVVQVAGSAEATGPGGQARALSVGTSLFSGDSIRTARASHVVLAFRDQSKVTVTADSEFKLEDVRFTARGEDGNFAVRIVRGGIRALTGLLAKRNPKAVRFGITTAVIGLRGTGVDAQLATQCLTLEDIAETVGPGLSDAKACGEGAFVHTWQDAVDLRAGERSLAIDAGRTGIYLPAADLLALLKDTPQFMADEPAPRPDAIDVDFDALFAAAQVESYDAGFYVGMRDGDVEFRGPAGQISLSADEAGALLRERGVPVRFTPYPLFMLNDPHPTPEAFDERSFRALERLNPGDLICEIR